MKTLRFITLVTVVLITATTSSFAQSALKDRFGELVFTGGAWLNSPSKIWVEDEGSKVQKGTSFLIKIMGDIYLNQNFALGLYTNFCPGYNHQSLQDEQIRNV